MATSSETYVGIDVAKERLDVAVLGEDRASKLAIRRMELLSCWNKCRHCSQNSLWWKPPVAINALSWMHCSMLG